jgi:hypothetical protein
MSISSRPFTIQYPPVLNETILSYLPPYNLKNMTASDQKDFEAEFYLQRPAAKAVPQSWKLLVENLISTLERLSGAVLPPANELQSDEARYLDIVKKNQKVLFDMLEAYFEGTAQGDCTPLFNSLIMHFCVASQYYSIDSPAAEAIIGRIFKSKNAEVFLNYLMQSDFKIIADEKVWFQFVYNAILDDVPGSLLLRLIQMGKKENQFLTPKALSVFNVFSTIYNPAHRPVDYYNVGLVFTTPLLLALKTDKRSDIVLLLIEEFPQDINPTLAALNKIKGQKRFRNLDLSPAAKYRYENQQQAIASKTRVLMILDTYAKKHEIPLSSQDKEDSLNEIKQQLRDFKNPIHCLDMYDLHIHACYINNHYRPKLDSFLRVVSVGMASSYANTKKDFINSIRTRIYDILTAGEYVGSFNNPAQYLEICKASYDHPVFSDIHDKHGVDTNVKLRLKTRITEIEKTLNPVLLTKSIS